MIKRILCVISKYDYGFPLRGLSTEYILFYETMERLGYDVLLFDFPSVLKRFGRYEMNQMLLDTVKAFEPDVMFTHLSKDELDVQTLSTITHTTSTITAANFGDDEWRFDNFSSRFARAFDWIVTTDKKAVEKYRRLGCENVIYKCSGVNHSYYKKRNLNEIYDCTFVGGARLDRVQIFKKLKKDGINVNCWGTGWDMGIIDRVLNKLLINPMYFQRKTIRTRLSFEDMSQVFEKSQINLGLSESYRGNRKQIKGRPFDVTASGGFFLGEYVEGIEEFFEIGKEIVCYEGYDELKDKIRYYLSHEVERKAIAEAGHKRTLSCHTAEKRLVEIFTEIGL